MRALRTLLHSIPLLVLLSCQSSTSIDVRPFHITLVYAKEIPSWWQEAFESAARRWEQVIRSDLPVAILDVPAGEFPLYSGLGETPAFTGIERGVRIYVNSYYSPSAYPEAVGGPVLQRPLPGPTTILGLITINRSVQAKDMPAERLRYIAVHEMGHVLGLSALVQGIQPSWLDGQRGITKGRLTLEGYQKQFQVVVDSLDVSNGFHWPFGGDVMSAVFPFNRITYVSIGALMDLGYPAVWEGAGRY